MNHSSELIVLSSTKVGEKNIVLHTLSREWGRRSFMTSAGKGSAMAKFLPLNILDAEITENAKSDLWRMKGISICYPLNGIRGNLHKNTMTLFMSEVLFRTIKDGAMEDGLYEWCRKSILTLDALERDFSNYHLRFLLELASVLGFSPTDEGIAPFAGEYYREIHDLIDADFASFMIMPLNGAARNDIAAILLKYISFHTESAINVQSLKVLRELYR